ncbi:MAG: SpoIIIAH-like family protein, partial [Ruminococcus sp.]|nr:SpoIIIAH-like family protein [Ruminococcus sp.]
EVKTMAMEVLELVDSSEEAKEEAVEQLNRLEDTFISQNRVETTLRAKGFSDCLCVLSKTSCTVIVPKDEMEENSAVIIKACVDDVADLPFEKINIVGAE